MRNRCMTHLVIGASGAIGSSLIPALVDDGVVVIAAVHRTPLSITSDAVVSATTYHFTSTQSIYTFYHHIYLLTFALTQNSAF